MELQARPSDPLITTRWLDVAFILLWVIYAVWGFVSVILGLPTLNMLTNDWYQIVWSGMIGLLSLNAAFWATMVFFVTPTIRQLSKKRIEFATVIVLISFVAIYPFLLIMRSFMGDLLAVGATAVLSFSYLVFPILRLYILRTRIRTMKTMVTTDAS